MKASRSLLSLSLTLLPTLSIGSNVSFAAATAPLSGEQPYWVEEVASGLEFPSSMAWLPNGDMLIAEKPGRLRLLQDGVLDKTPVSGVPATFYNTFDGLRDIAVDPDYRQNRKIYLLISEGTFEQRHAAVYSAHYESRRLTGLTRIFRSKDEIGGAGMIAGRMGAEAVEERMRGRQCRVPLGINLVKTNDPERPSSDEEVLRDYATAFRTLQKLGSYVTLNLSCPNSANDRNYFDVVPKVNALLGATRRTTTPSPDISEAKADHRPTIIAGSRCQCRPVSIHRRLCDQPSFREAF